MHQRNRTICDHEGYFPKRLLRIHQSMILQTLSRHLSLKRRWRQRPMPIRTQAQTLATEYWCR